MNFTIFLFRKNYFDRCVVFKSEANGIYNDIVTASFYEKLSKKTLAYIKRQCDLKADTLLFKQISKQSKPYIVYVFYNSFDIDDDFAFQLVHKAGRQQDFKDYRLKDVKFDYQGHYFVNSFLTNKFDFRHLNTTLSFAHITHLKLNGDLFKSDVNINYNMTVETFFIRAKDGTLYKYKTDGVLTHIVNGYEKQIYYNDFFFLVQCFKYCKDYTEKEFVEQIGLQTIFSADDLYELIRERLAFTNVKVDFCTKNVTLKRNVNEFALNNSIRLITLNSVAGLRYGYENKVVIIDDVIIDKLKNTLSKYILLKTKFRLKLYLNEDFCVDDFDVVVE